MPDNRRTLNRDVQVSVVPAGDTVTLPVGTQVDITHRLGGNFTVVCDYGMFRINGKDADVLGEEIPETATANAPETAPEGPVERPSEEAVWEQMKTVYDPEIPVNIVDLGLVYSMQILDEAPTVDVAAAGNADGAQVKLADNGEPQPASEAAVESINETAAPEPSPSETGYFVSVKMTLTAPGCGMGPVIAEDAKTRIEALHGVRSAQVDIVWDPPWDQSMISEEGKMELGLI
jgi:metal-sulfur cluster biosynthetic enzyme